jgi:transposase-like protein
MDKLDRHCPACDEDRTFSLWASTELHLGQKTKYHCPECEYGFVRIDETVDTNEA